MTRFMVLLLIGCGSDDDVGKIPDAPPCIEGTIDVELTAPDAYACHAPFMSTVRVTNGSCNPITIENVKIRAMVTAGPCGPAGPGTYDSAAPRINSLASAVVLDLESGPFCCTAPGPCPTPMQCDETFTFDVVTSAGTFSSASSAHVSLDGCDEVCQ